MLESKQPEAETSKLEGGQPSPAGVSLADFIRRFLPETAALAQIKQGIGELIALASGRLDARSKSELRDLTEQLMALRKRHAPGKRGRPRKAPAQAKAAQPAKKRYSLTYEQLAELHEWGAEHLREHDEDVNDLAAFRAVLTGVNYMALEDESGATQKGPHWSDEEVERTAKNYARRFGEMERAKASRK
jgi:hypothetical protein